VLTVVKKFLGREREKEEKEKRMYIIFTFNCDMHSHLDFVKLRDFHL
jgi:hypothetical protein